jgi:hypothetical protein
MSVYIPAKVRGPIYAAYAILGLVLGATQVGFASANAGQPVWLTVALAVFAFVGTGIGYTAASNTPTSNPPPDYPRPLSTYGSKSDATYHGS